MSQTEMTMVEEKNQVGSTNMFKTLGLYLKGDHVFFHTHFSSPEPSDVSYDVSKLININDYKRGIEELRETGRCKLGELIITASPDGGGVTFNTPGKYGPYSSPARSDFDTQWTIDQISLPGTPPNCRAKKVVPNIFRGDRWG